jgi:hypothetical protein
LIFACLGAGTVWTPAHGHADTDRPFLALSVDSVAPSTITATSDPILAVVATVTNIGDRTVENIKARLERAPAVATARGLRGALRLDEQDFDVTSHFVAEVDRLTPGQRKQFTLSVHLRSGENPAADSDSDANASLRITRPGVYPVLVNVNGTPAYGSTARLAAARFLLPVLGVPADPGAAGSAAGAIAPGTGTPVPTTLLWPLADRPRRVAGQAGSATDPVELTDDDLAAELAAGGRLDTLLGALEFATNPDADPDGKLGNSVCLGIDPDLLLTVSAMANGYLVPVDPADPAGATRHGNGRAAAADWLARLRALASTLCTVALPFGQVDLRAITAVNNANLTASAVNSPADIVDVLLSTKSVRDITWPAAGAIDDQTGALLRSMNVSTVLVGSDAVHSVTTAATATTGNADPTPPPQLVSLPGTVTNTTATNNAVTSTNPGTDPSHGAAGNVSTGTGQTPLHAATYDTSVTAALAAVGDRPQTPSITPLPLRYNLDADSRQARLQDALGALSWTALNPTPGYRRGELIAPPQLWQPDNNEANAVLAQLTQLLRTGLATPRSLSDLVGQTPTGAPYDLDYLPEARMDAPMPALTNPVRTRAARLDTISDALVDDAQGELTPYQFITPLRQDLLRGLSLAGRTETGQNRVALDTAEHTRVVDAGSTIDTLFGRVTVLSPGGVYTLAASHSPLLVVARNQLPVAIRVRVKTDAPADMHISDVGVVQLPANGTRSLQIPAKVTDSRSMVVQFSLDTPAGAPLGGPISVSVRSNAYGKALAIITECAGALLLLLMGRRLWRRFRGRPDPADEGLDASTRRRLNRYSRAKRDRARSTSEIPQEPACPRT